MAENREQPAILIEVRLFVKKIEEVESESFIGIKRDMRPTLFVNEFNFISIVQECEALIEPGGNGMAKLLMPTEALLETDVNVGSQVEVRSGTTIIAIAEILSMKRVFVKKDASSERGYIIVAAD